MMSKFFLSIFTLLFSAPMLFAQLSVPPPSANVPTLSEWGLIILGLALLVFAVVSIVAKRKGVSTL